MKLSAVAIILLSSITTSFAGNFTPIPKIKIAQTTCLDNCQRAFVLCLGVCGSNCTSLSNNRPAVSRNCDVEQAICQRGCQFTPGG